MASHSVPNKYYRALSDARGLDHSIALTYSAFNRPISNIDCNQQCASPLIQGVKEARRPHRSLGKGLPLQVRQNTTVTEKRGEEHETFTVRL